MKCPLLKYRDDISSGRFPYDVRDCLQAECAWWDIVLEDCSFRVASKALDRLERTLSEIKEKLPQARQSY